MSELCTRIHGDGYDRPAADGLALCWSCITRMERALAEMPALYADLAHALVPRRGDAPRITGGDTTSLPINLAAAATRHDIDTYTRGLAAWVAAERGHHPPALGVSATCAWLTRHIEWIAAQPEAAEVADWLGDLRGRALAVISPTGRRHFTVHGDEATCLEDGCEGRLVATLDGIHSVLRCDLHPEVHVYPISEWLAFGRRLHQGSA
jgi:hypothetical protein